MKIFERLLDLPFKLLGSLRTLLSIVCLIFLALLLYSQKPVKDAVDEAAKRVEELAPPVARSGKRALELVGLKRPDPSVGQLFLEKLQAVPQGFWDLGKHVGDLSLKKLLDVLFHPITIVMGVLVGYLAWTGRLKAS